MSQQHRNARNRPTWIGNARTSDIGRGAVYRLVQPSRLWRDVTNRLVASEFPEIDLETLLVDAAAMHLLSRPGEFDVIVTENMFGDILTDEASMLAGSLGMLPSASLGVDAAMYEPAHGSAPDIAGKGICNPSAVLLAYGSLLSHLGEPTAGNGLRDAIREAIAAEQCTRDIGGEMNTKQFTEAVCERLVSSLATT